MIMLPLNIPGDINKYFFSIEKKDIELINAYLNMLNNDISNQFLITGYLGVGKTFFLKKILYNQSENILTTYIDLSEIYGREYGEIYDFTMNSNILDIPIPIIKDNYCKLSEFVMELPQKLWILLIILMDLYWLMRSYSQRKN